MKYIVVVFFVLASYFILAQLPKGYPNCYNEWRKYKISPIELIDTIKKDSMIYFDLKGLDSLYIMSNKFLKRRDISIRSMQLLFRKYSIY